MSEQPPGPKRPSPSKEVARLYSLAQGPGNRYTGYSASRKQVKERFSDRAVRAYAERAGVKAAEALHPHIVEPKRPARFRTRPREEAAWPIDKERPLSKREGDELERALYAALGEPFEDGSLLPKKRPLSRQAFPTPIRSSAEPLVALPPGFALRPPAVVVFSHTGAVGKTCVVASLGRALSALGEQVLLADTAQSGELPRYFGAQGGKPGSVRSLSPAPYAPDLVGGDRNINRVPVTLLNLEAEHFPHFASGQDLLLGELVQESRGYNRLLIDVATGGAEIRRLLLLLPVILIPISPDINTVPSLQSIESLLGQALSPQDQARVFFLLNQFDDSAELHRDLRETLREQFGDQLVPFPIRSSPAVAEALAQGVTVLDYAPDSDAAQDFRSLAAWLRRLEAPRESDFGKDESQEQ